MKRIIILSIIVLILLTPVGILSYSYYSPPKKRVAYQALRHDDDTLRIAFIGDSWAFLHKSHSHQLSAMIENKLHHPIIVKSYGICGLTSKEIYEAFFEDNSYKEFMMYGFDYCIISSGINDTYKKMGVSYYKRSMDLIIQFLLANNISPIILEIPDYDIQKAYERQITWKKMLRQLSMSINDTPLECKQLFRDALNELIKEKGYEQKVTIMRYKEWNANYEEDLKELYTDCMHLNQEGYNKLDNCLTSQITLLVLMKK